MTEPGPATGASAASGAPTAAGWPGTNRRVSLDEPTRRASPGMETVTMPAVSASAPRATTGTRASTRRAKLVVSKVNTWSIVKVSFLYSICLFVILLVATATLWSVLNSAGVFDSVRHSAQDITNKPEGGISDWLSLSRVMSMAALIGVANIILVTALSAIGALLYNVCTDVVGGVEVTLSEQN